MKIYIEVLNSIGAYARIGTFFEALERIAKQRGVDLNSVIRGTYVGPATVKRWKSGGVPPRTTLRVCARALGLPDETFFFYRNAIKPAA
ncbi:MAG: hypothetical protein H2172_16330 [Opitutus sp.]|nr:hypothetical protein [Opitutus sp.]MCS6248714.1 hypothetical protein [Opitutus sp.]MCS6275575.1 hypothetical protein [Opitutus sp.]MCS6299797.1 hypothetical protein [Opitutus sp.]